MGIVAEDVARVREATDFVQVASEHVALKKVGRRWVGLCPFHAERTPSFSVNAEEGLYYCFGCQAKGDVITFLRDLEHLEFAETVERLAARAGITLRYDDDTRGAQDRQRRSRLLEAMEKAVTWYHERLLGSSDAAAARGYLRSRGYDGEVVRRFSLGWAPEGWDTLAASLSLPDDVLADTGLGFVNRANRQQDAFRARVMFPIFDASGRAVAFGGRVLPGGDGPKYKNSQETPIYSKRKVLYGLNWAKDEVVQQGEVVVCEGYTDVIGMSRAGVRRAVATCGTALGEEHVRLLKGFASRVVLAFDADSAGQAAAQRLYAWEQKEQVDFAVAGFPVGTDPGDLARTDPDALRRAVEEARPFLAFRIERELGAADLRSPEGRARAAAAAMSAIAEHPNELVRDQYVREVADRCQVDPDKLRALGARTPAAPSSRPAPRRRRADPPSPETEALRLAVHVPEKMADKLEEVLFHDELHLAAFRALAAADTLHGAIAAADPGAGELLQRLAVEDTEADPDDVATLLVRAAARRAVAQLETQARSAPERAVELAPTIGWLTSEVQRLEDHRTRLEAGGRLVAWLLGRVEEDA